MIRPIGYYVHHQGAGHRHRAELIAAKLESPCTLIGTFAADRITQDPAMLNLPDDRLNDDVDFAGADFSKSRPNAFHYAPLRCDGVRHRMASLAAWIEQVDPTLIVVDVSVEIALFARLMSIPTAVVRLAGSRFDRPHLEAFRSAEHILAPFPEIFESLDVPDWVRHKTFYGGFLAKPASPSSTAAVCRRVAVVFGKGGAMADPSYVSSAARAIPDVAWHVYGPIKGERGELRNLHFHGWTQDIGGALDAADVVVGGAGDGLLGEVAVRAKRFVCVPEKRAFQEQENKARVLAAHDMAVVLQEWPQSSAWRNILQQAEALDTGKLHALTASSAISAFASIIEGLAAAKY